MTARARIPIFDGHNDTLLQLSPIKRTGGRSLFEQSKEGHLDLPRARAGGFGGGMFAVCVPPNPDQPDVFVEETPVTETDVGIKLQPAVDHSYAQQFTLSAVGRLFRLVAESNGQVQVVRTVDELEHCLDQDILAIVLHFEGAEAIDPALDGLYAFYEAGLRSLGPVWSRPNAFGYGVPFKFPLSPDTGPGLTEAGKELVRACNRLGILIDLSHLNERGFWDVARLSDAPLVATHSAAHTLTPSARNLTDAQLDAIGESDGVVGVNFYVADLRADGRVDPDTPLTDVVRHIDYISTRIGIDHVAFGSDFDGATIPQEIGDVTGLPRLVEALRTHGYDEQALRKTTHENWLRVLRLTWRQS